MNIPETILKHIIKLDIPSTTWQVFLFILHTIECTEGQININDIANKIGTHHNSIFRSIKILKDRNIIRKDNLRNYVILNTNINEWVLQVERQVKETRHKPVKPVEVKVHPLFDTEGFRKFYEVYPRKMGFKKAMEAWTKLCPSSELAEHIISQVVRFKKSEEWKKGYIPSPVNFIEGERWKDQLEYKKDWRDG